MIAKLTKRFIDTLTPSDRDLFVWDTEVKGFGLKITPAARRVFLCQYWAPGLARVRRRMTLGSYGVLTVDQAREAAKRILGRVSSGEDPAAEAQAARKEAKDATVAAVSAEFLIDVQGKIKPRTWDEYNRLLKANILPALGRKPIAHVALRDVAALHSAHRKNPSLANHILTLLGTLLYWSETRGYRARGTNPTKDVTKYPEQFRERYLTVDEVARLGAALTKAEKEGLAPAPSERKTPSKKRKRNAGMFSSEIQPADPFSVAAIRFLLLTGWRRNEALSLKWSDVDLERGAATLADTKTGRSYRAIGAPACELLASLPRLADNPYVFPSRITGQHLTEVRRTWTSVRHEAKLDDVRLHDLRHNLASWSVAGGHSLYLTGKLLGHARAETTQRYAHLQDDVRKAVADSVSGAIASALDGKTAKVKAIR